ncbi:uncharacterized protein LOC135385972 isoform X4 [Ornithodoros turicata]|uniref:uncharacterized protein LOC135385972 isoform X4 n=1 Tax=Ornithodoros turicata TaxID=34597 RepID=UPI0031396893
MDDSDLHTKAQEQSSSSSCSVKATRRNKDTKADLPPLAIAAVKEHWIKSNKIFMLDYDGTLNPIQTMPGHAQPSVELIDLLVRFNKKARAVICTGRQKEQVDMWFPAEIEIYAEHGAYRWKDGVWRRERAPLDLAECIKIMEEYKKASPDIVLEVKSTALAFHYRHVKDFDPTEMIERLRLHVGDAVIQGNGIVDIRTVSKDVPCAKVGPAICAGDDVTDEDMFDACTGLSICVGKRPSKADCYVEKVGDILELLEELIKIC